MIYCFDEYRLDTDRRELHHGSRSVPVEPQVFDVLVYLIANRDRVVSKDDLLGAVWNGRIISESALTTRINAARAAVGDSGREQRLIRTLLRKGLRFIGEVQEEADKLTQSAFPQGEAFLQQPGAALALPDRPSIAVLPFQNLSGDVEQEYFADGMVEEITTALSRFRNLFVIARNSSFTYKGRAVDVKQVGRELGVRYVLEGSVRKAGDKLRIAAQLIDASNNAHIWADRFDGALEDVFDLQDQVTLSVISALTPMLEFVEMERAKRKPTESLQAYDYYLRGLSCAHQWTSLEINREALRLLYKAIELDPNFASAYGAAAWTLAQRKASGWMTDRAQEIAETTRLARRAAELGRNDAVALRMSAWALAFVAHDLDAGAAIIERALKLNPNLGMAWNISGFIRLWHGEPEVAIEHFTRAMRLSPLDPLFSNIHFAIAHAYFFAERYDTAASFAAKVLQERPNYQPALRIAAASNAFAGNTEEARRAVNQLQRVDSALRVSNLRDALGPYPPHMLSQYEEALRQAGLPE